MKKTLTTVLAFVLVAAISVCGTLAILKQQTGPVTNTFSAAAGIVESMTLNESLAEYNTNTGLYTLNSDEKVTSNTYNKVVPCTEIPKDPTFTIDIKEDALVYVFIEVKSTLNTALTYSIDSSWTALTGVTGPHSGTVYSYVSGPVQGTSAGNEFSHTILANNKITAGDFSTTGDLGDIVFYGYVCQAQGSASASAAWTAASFSAEP